MTYCSDDYSYLLGLQKFISTTINIGLIHHTVCLFMSQLLLVSLSLHLAKEGWLS